MKNLEQIRASNALKATHKMNFSGQDGGEVAKKVPTLIRESGLLATLAFALEMKEKNKRFVYVHEGMKNIMDSIVKHLSHPDIRRLPTSIEDADQWMTSLVKNASAIELQDQTAEAMAYLSYFRRFATKG